MNVFRVVLAGCGNMSRQWLRALGEHFAGEIEVVGLVDLDVRQARDLREMFGLEGVVVGTDLAQMLRDLRPDAVFDVTVPSAHHAVALTAMEQGCHVLCEKPLADTVDHAREMIDMAEREHKVLSVIQNRRYHPGIRTVRRFLESGKLGQLHTLNVDFYLAPHFGGFREEMEHVLLLDMAIHTFDQARFLLGGTRAMNVFCHEYNPAGSWYSSGAAAMAIFQMEDASVLNYRGCWCAEGLQTSWQGQWRIIGAEGTLFWDGEMGIRAESPQGAPKFFNDMRAHEVQPVEMAPHRQGHAGLIGDFLRAVRDGKKAETHAEDNIHSLAMVEAAIRSAVTGQRVTL